MTWAPEIGRKFQNSLEVGIQPDLKNLVHKKVGWVGCKDVGVFWCHFFWRFFCETWLLRLILRKVTSVNSPILLPILFENQKGLIFKKRKEKTQPKTPQRVSRTLGVSLDCVTSCWFVLLICENYTRIWCPYSSRTKKDWFSKSERKKPNQKHRRGFLGP